MFSLLGKLKAYCTMRNCICTYSYLLVQAYSIFFKYWTEQPDLSSSLCPYYVYQKGAHCLRSASGDRNSGSIHIHRMTKNSTSGHRGVCAVRTRLAGIFHLFALLVCLPLTVFCLGRMVMAPSAAHSCSFTGCTLAPQESEPRATQNGWGWDVTWRGWNEM